MEKMAQAVLPWSLGSAGWRQSCQLTMQKSKTGDAACLHPGGDFRLGSQRKHFSWRAGTREKTLQD